jgi:hypothetical protein
MSAMAQRTQRWRVLNLALGIEEAESALVAQAATVAGVDARAIHTLRIARRSVDARRRGGERRLRFVVHADIELSDGPRSRAFQTARRAGRIVEVPPSGSFRVDGALPGHLAAHVVVVGAGPAGLFAAHVLALNGVAVSLIDRGAELFQRGSDVVRFHRSRTPNLESNLLFGEGGAGTYSDGKLFTRIDDPLEVPCLQELVDCGATEEILFDSRAHIGTDRLHRILPVFRHRLESMGVRFHWNTRLDSLTLDRHGRVIHLDTSQGAIGCDAVFLAPGHSARDTIRMLADRGVEVAAKPFQLGVRIEHPQELIDRGRYGTSPQARLLGPAYYNLVAKRCRTHSFCMCPGGTIVASVNTPGVLCTNGMSNSQHSSPWANAALVTTFGPEDFGTKPFSGIEFQEAIERSFFEAGGLDYTAPAQTAEDFLRQRPTPKPRHSSYTFGTAPGRIDLLLPAKARQAIDGALREFDHMIPGFGGPDGLLVGIESRSSGAVRLPRHAERLHATDIFNLYPIGEGAGYAGGIMSAAIDGARSAKRYLEG